MNTFRSGDAATAAAMPYTIPTRYVAPSPVDVYRCLDRASQAAGAQTPPRPNRARPTDPAVRWTADESADAAPRHSPQKSSRNRLPRCAACCPAPRLPRYAPTRRPGRARGPGQPIDGHRRAALGLRRAKAASPPSAWRIGSPRSRLRACTSTRCPSASSTRAVARPMPSVAPVMPMTAMVVILPGRAARANGGRRLLTSSRRPLALVCGDGDPSGSGGGPLCGARDRSTRARSPRRRRRPSRG